MSTTGLFEVPQEVGVDPGLRLHLKLLRSIRPLAAVGGSALQSHNKNGWISVSSASFFSRRFDSSPAAVLVAA